MCTACAWSHLSSYQPFGLSSSAPFITCGCTEKTSERAVQPSYLHVCLRMGCGSLRRYPFLFISKKTISLTSSDSVVSFEVLGVTRKSPTKNPVQRASGPTGSMRADPVCKQSTQNMTGDKQMNSLCCWRTTLLCTAHLQRPHLFPSLRKIRYQ